MEKVAALMRRTYKELRLYPAFYSLMTIGCPLIYALLLWLDNWGNVP